MDALCERNVTLGELSTVVKLTFYTAFYYLFSNYSDRRDK